MEKNPLTNLWINNNFNLNVVVIENEYNHKF